jgi:hypothetical protein
MQPCRDSVCSDAGITVWRRCAPLVFALLVCLLHAGCRASAPSAHQSTELVLVGGSGPVVRPQFSAAARLADRFATAYARSAYLRHPPRLPGTTAVVRRSIAVAATRVPPSRRGRHPRALALVLRPARSHALAARVRIGDGYSPPFSVAFLVRRRGPNWRVVAISPPG